MAVKKIRASRARRRLWDAFVSGTLEIGGASPLQDESEQPTEPKMTRRHRRDHLRVKNKLAGTRRARKAAARIVRREAKKGLAA